MHLHLLWKKLAFSLGLKPPTPTPTNVPNPAPPSRTAGVDPEVAAAIAFSSLREASSMADATDFLTQQDVEALTRGLLRLRQMDDTTQETLRGQMALLFGDRWQDESKRFQCILDLLRGHVTPTRQIPPPLVVTPMQKTAMLIASLPADLAPLLSTQLLRRLTRKELRELTAELACLPAATSRSLERTADEFLTMMSNACESSDMMASPGFLRLEIQRLSLANPLLFAGFLKYIWLDQRQAVQRFQDTVRTSVERTADWLVLYMHCGASVDAYLSGADKAAVLLECAAAEAAEQMRLWLESNQAIVPPAARDPLPQEKRAVMQEFLRRFYTQFSPVTEARYN